MSYLIDSDWLIDGSGMHPAAVELLEHAASQGAAISVISLGEIYEGAVGQASRNGQDRVGEMRAYLAAYPVLGLSDPIMERFARLRSSLRRQGRTIPDLDLLIAATALEHDLILMTRNVRHFERIHGLVLYQE